MAQTTGFLNLWINSHCPGSTASLVSPSIPPVMARNLRAVDSLHASYSFKYFGQDKSVRAYTFIDMRHFLPYALVISSAEHEAHICH